MINRLREHGREERVNRFMWSLNAHHSHFRTLIVAVCLLSSLCWCASATGHARNADDPSAQSRPDTEPEAIAASNTADAAAADTPVPQPLDARTFAQAAEEVIGFYYGGNFSYTEVPGMSAPKTIAAVGEEGQAGEEEIPFGDGEVDGLADTRIAPNLLLPQDPFQVEAIRNARREEALFYGAPLDNRLEWVDKTKPSASVRVNHVFPPVDSARIRRLERFRLQIITRYHLEMNSLDGSRLVLDFDPLDSAALADLRQQVQQVQDALAAGSESRSARHSSLEKEKQEIMAQFAAPVDASADDTARGRGPPKSRALTSDELAALFASLPGAESSGQSDEATETESADGDEMDEFMEDSDDPTDELAIGSDEPRTQSSDADSSKPAPLLRFDFEVFGRVQGVSFRAYTQEQAQALGVVGAIQNTAHGTVRGWAQGTADVISILYVLDSYWFRSNC